jgi:hypothetical protein
MSDFRRLKPPPSRKAKASAPPVLIESAADFAFAMRRRREGLGWTGEILDARIGWADRYTAKCENPGETWGKTQLRFAQMAPLWLDGLNARLVLVDREFAHQLTTLPTPHR